MIFTKTIAVKSEKNTPIEHQNVPIAHQGLHGFLYSSEHEHSADASIIAPQSDGTAIVALSAWEKQAGNAKVAGVYAVLDSDRLYQYVGYSRDILRSLRGHIAQNGTQVCTFVRIQTFKFPKRQIMEALKNEWIAEISYTPTGNTGEQGTWARTIGEAAKATMTNAERDAYEDKKLKLRKAMADTTLTDKLTSQATQSEAEIKRRHQLETAVKNDDWSSVIDSQT